MTSTKSLISDNVEFVLIEDEQDPIFEKYKNMFEKSKLIEESIKESYNNYSINIKEFDTLLYDNLEIYSKFKVSKEKEKHSIANYKNTNISFINDNILFKNSIDIKDILIQFGIIENNDSEKDLRIIRIIEKIIKQKCSLEYIPEAKRYIVKYPIMFTDLEIPIVLAIYKDKESNKMHNKIIGYVNYRDIDIKSIFIEFIEVNPEYRNMNLCKRMISYLISQKPNTKKFELINAGGLSGYSCYVDAFESNNFNIKIKNTDKKIKKTKLNNIRLKRKSNRLNLTKLDNISINRKFDGDMYFTKIIT
jgi:hypothetical protein